MTVIFPSYARGAGGRPGPLPAVGGDPVRRLVAAWLSFSEHRRHPPAGRPPGPRVPVPSSAKATISYGLEDKLFKRRQPRKESYGHRQPDRSLTDPLPTGALG